MLDSYVVMGLVMVIVGALKTLPLFTKPRGKLLVPLLVFAVAGTLNVLNALVFGGVILSALKEGLIVGAAAGGIYSMGKKAMDYKVETVESLSPTQEVKSNSLIAKEVEQTTNLG